MSDCQEDLLKSSDVRLLSGAQSGGCSCEEQPNHTHATRANCARCGGARLVYFICAGAAPSGEAEAIARSGRRLDAAAKSKSGDKRGTPLQFKSLILQSATKQRKLRAPSVAACTILEQWRFGYVNRARTDNSVEQSKNEQPLIRYH